MGHVRVSALGGSRRYRVAGVRSDRLRRAVRVAGLLVVITLLAGCASSRGRPQTSAMAAAPPAPVVVTQAIQTTVPVYEEAVAQTIALETITLRAQIAGTIEQLLFDEGTPVKKGQALAVIDQRPYAAALESAQAQLANAQAALEQALQQVQLRQAQATLASLQATLVYDQTQVKRDQELLAGGAIAQQQLDLDTATMSAQAANVAAQEAVVRNTALSTRIGIDQARAQVRTNQANVRQAQLNLVYTTVPAPVDGVISLRSVDRGNYIQVAQQVATIATVDPIIAQFPLSEVIFLELAQRTKPGTPSRGVAAGDDPQFELILPDGTPYPHPGTYRTVNNMINPQSGTIMAQALFPNPERLLRPGMYGRVRVKIQDRPHTVLIPQEAVQQVQGAETVYVVAPDNSVLLRSITSADQYGPFVAVLSGVSAGERVIVQGVQKVRPGAKVSPILRPAPPLPAGIGATGGVIAPTGRQAALPLPQR